MATCNTSSKVFAILTENIKSWIETSYFSEKKVYQKLFVKIKKGTNDVNVSPK